MKQSIDYGKIIFVGVPLLFMLWAFMFISLIAILGGNKVTLYLSLTMTVFFAIGYWILAIRNARKVDAVVIDHGNSANKSRYSKHLSSMQIVYAGVFTIFIFCTLAVEVIFYNVPHEKVFMYILPFLMLFVIAEKLYLRWMAHNKSQERTD